MNRSATIDPANIHQVNEFKHPNPLTTLKADPTGRFVAAGAQDLDIQRARPRCASIYFPELGVE